MGNSTIVEAPRTFIFSITSSLTGSMVKPLATDLGRSVAGSRVLNQETSTSDAYRPGRDETMEQRLGGVWRYTESLISALGGVVSLYRYSFVP
jgi:hypothetical protein